MTSPRESLEAVKRAIDSAGRLPEEISYLLHEADAAGQDSDVSLPLIEIQPLTSERVNPNNTDFVGFTTDDAGNHTGRIYRSQYELSAQIDVWTAQGGRYSPDDLGEAVRRSLYQHASHGPDKPFRDENEQVIDSMFRFELGDGERADDLVQTPTLRRWRQDVVIWAYEEFKTTEDYIVSVDYPSDLHDSDGDNVIEN